MVQKVRQLSGDMGDALQPHEQELGQFAISASTSAQERRHRTLKHDDTFAVFDPNGDAIAGPSNPEGIFHRDTRHLSQLMLAIFNLRPMLLSSTLREDNAALICDLTNPDVFDAQGNVLLAHDLIHVRRSRFLWRGTCHERMLVRNYDDRPQRVTLDVHFAADFADIFEVRGARRARRGELRRPQVENSKVTLGYRGLDGRARTTRLRFDPAPQELTAGCARFVLDLASRETICVFVEVACDDERVERRAARRAFFSDLR